VHLFLLLCICFLLWLTTGDMAVTQWILGEGCPGLGHSSPEKNKDNRTNLYLVINSEGYSRGTLGRYGGGGGWFTTGDKAAGEWILGKLGCPGLWPFQSGEK
jgi:hypothetical protein